MPQTVRFWANVGHGLPRSLACKFGAWGGGGGLAQAGFPKPHRDGMVPKN